jgi:hypothetical protein
MVLTLIRGQRRLVLKTTRVICRAGLITAAILTLLPAAQASERLMGVAELVARSDVVVRAEITGYTSSMMDTPQGRLPFIFYKAKTKSLINGICPAEFTVRVPGLISGDRAVVFSDAPPLARGVEAVLFLKKGYGVEPDSKIYDLVGFASGVLPVLPAAEGKEARVLMPVKTQAGPSRRSRVQVRLSDFIVQVKAAVENRQRSEKK